MSVASAARSPIDALRALDRLLSQVSRARDTRLPAGRAHVDGIRHDGPGASRTGGRPACERVWLTSSERPALAASIYRDAAAPARRIPPRRAMTMRFDACLAADLVWASLPRGTRRVQMFHGVAGKFSQLYDRPAMSMREWHRLFFINQRRLRNFIAAGALDAAATPFGSLGMPKTDCLVDGTFQRDDVLASRRARPGAARRCCMHRPGLRTRR